MNPKLSPLEIDTIVNNLQLCYPNYRAPQIRALLELELTQANNTTKDLLLSKLAYLLERNPPTMIVVQDDVIDVTTPEKERESSQKLKRDKSFTRITEFFPDADESFVRDLINKVISPFRLIKKKAPIDTIEETVSNSLIENKYPKKVKVTPVSPPPKQAIDYNKYDVPVSVQYKHLCVLQLANEFPLISMKDIRNVTNKYNGHYYPSRKNLIENKFKLNKKTRPIATLPAVDLDFEKELKWVKEQIALDREKQDLELAQKLNETEYELTGQAIDCSCCFGSFPLEEMVQCADGHLFCGGCLKKYVEESLFGVGRAALHCMSSEGCKESFPDSQVKKVLPSLLYEKWVQRLQDEELQKAGIANLAACPFCDFKVEIENPDDKILKCQNVSCMKESCRLCKEENHIPLRCNEVETKKQAETRVSIEEIMTEALLRVCPKCSVKFYKTEGCNKMTCTCGTSICYICKVHLHNGYDHFCKCAGLVDGMETGKCRKCGKCLVHTKDTQALDSNRVKAAEVEAKRKLTTDPPTVTPKKTKL